MLCSGIAFIGDRLHDAGDLLFFIRAEQFFEHLFFLACRDGVECEMDCLMLQCIDIMQTAQSDECFGIDLIEIAFQLELRPSR